MPIEHEHKIVLRDAERLFASLSPAMYRLRTIEQLYLNDNARFRHIRYDPSVPNSPVSEYTFTYKQMIGGRLLEIEPREGVSKDDYELARTAAVSSLVKQRFVMADHDGNHVDVDFLLTARPEEGGTIYFAMAEVETDEDAQWSVMPYLEPYVELVVTREFNWMFTNARLTDRSYAARVLNEYRVASRNLGGGDHESFSGAGS